MFLISKTKEVYMICLSLKQQNHYIQPKLEYSRSIIVMYVINQLYGLNYGTWGKY